jgi:hypothetical protein
MKDRTRISSDLDGFLPTIVLAVNFHLIRLAVAIRMGFLHNSG